MYRASSELTAFFFFRLELLGFWKIVPGVLWGVASGTATENVLVTDTVNLLKPTGYVMHHTDTPRTVFKLR